MSVQQPLLSVVVPVYDVAPYLDTCLQSVLDQDVPGMEIVLIDDGSTDGSGEAAASWAKAHEAMRILRQHNRGLGAARNAGVEIATGTYLTFVDSDDSIPPGSFRLLVESLEESGSDLAFGSVLWQTGSTSEELPWMRAIHRRHRVAVTLDEFPRMLGDPFACNKVFRRTFWDSAGLSFPEGLRYEDTVTVVQAFLRASAVDVLQEPLYRYRQRGDGTAITERRHEVANLQDRLESKRRAAAVVSELGSDQVREQWFTQTMAGDMLLYFREIPGCSEDYWNTLRDGVRALWPKQYPLWESRLLTPARLVAWLVAHDRREQATTLMQHLATHPPAPAIEVRGDQAVARLPYLDDPAADIPEALFRLARHELVWNARVLRVHEHDAVVDIDGFVLIRGVPTLGVETGCTAALVSADGTEIPIDVTMHDESQATRWVGRKQQNYDACGVRVRIDLAAFLRDHPVDDAGQSWMLRMVRHVRGIRRQGRFMSCVDTTPGTTLARSVDGDAWVRVEFVRDRGIVVRTGHA